MEGFYKVFVMLAGLTGKATLSSAQQCGPIISSESNKALSGFVIKSFYADNLWSCFGSCRNDSICQSINFNLQDRICQLNRETKRRQVSKAIDRDLWIYMENPSRAPLGSRRELPAHSCRQIREFPDESKGPGEYWVQPNSSLEPFQVICVLDSEIAESCQKIHQKHPTLPSGVYYLDSDGGNHGNPYLAYCDMTSHGGGWTMCYTTNNKVNLRTEVTYVPKKPYSTNGYRTNCNSLRFNEVLFIKEDTKASAYFRREGGQALRVADSYANDQSASRNGLWDGHGVANTAYKYLLLVCDKPFFKGFFISGFTGNCYKFCNHFCGDRTSDYYRTASSNVNYSGVAFKEQGHYPNIPAAKLISVGVRVKE